MHTRALAFDAEASLCAALIAWHCEHIAGLRERERLALHAAWRQWRCCSRAYRRFRFAMEHALAEAATFNRQRLKRAVIRNWSGRAAWVSANLEATFQLVRERHQAWQLHGWLRRRSAGPNADELLVMEAMFSEWHDVHVTQKDFRQRTQVYYARRAHALVVLALDQWVDVSLSANRSENLRRRRHVRFSPDLRSLRRGSSQGPIATLRSSQKTSARTISAGGAGQWAQKAGWEAAADPIEILQQDMVEKSFAETSLPNASPVPRAAEWGCAGSREALIRPDAVEAVQTGSGTHRRQPDLADTGSTISPAATANTTPQQSRASADMVFASVRPQLPELPLGLPDPKQARTAGAGGAEQAAAPSDVSALREINQFRSKDDALFQVDLWTKDRQPPSPSFEKIAPFGSRRESANSAYVQPSAATCTRQKTNDILRFFKVRGSAGA